MGTQLHEHDGIFNYWQPHQRSPADDLFWNVYSRYPDHQRCFPSVSPDQLLFYDPHRAKDMREAAEYFVSNIKTRLCSGRRHSGPSTLFQVLLPGGFEWLAAETSYSPHEVLLGALRGVSLAYGQETLRGAYRHPVHFPP